MKLTYVYIITNVQNLKRYVGISVDVFGRMRQHINYSKRAKRGIAKAIALYGVENFEVEISSSFENRKHAKLEEIRLILDLKTSNRDFGYNNTKGGDGNLGWKPTAETIQNMSLAAKEKFQNDPSLRHNHSQFMKILMSDPVQLKKISEGVKRAWNEMPIEKRVVIIQKSAISRLGKPSSIFGSRSHRTTLTEEKVEMIKNEFNEFIQTNGKTNVCRILMKRYDQGYNTIYKIVSNVTWRHVVIKQNV